MKKITLDWVTYNLTPVEDKQKHITVTWASGKTYKLSEPCINKKNEFKDETFFTHKEAVKQYSLPNISEWNDMIEWNLRDFITDFPGDYDTDGTGPHNSNALAYYWASDTSGSLARRLSLYSSVGAHLYIDYQNKGFQVRELIN